MRLFLVGLVVAVGVLCACTSRSGPTAGEVTLNGPVRTVELNVDAGGTVEVEGRADSASLSVRYEGGAPGGHTYAVHDGVLTLNGCGLRCSAHYQVTVPGDVLVRGSAGNGEVSLTAVAGIDVTTENGAVALADLDGGDVRVRSGNGAITGRALRTDQIRAQTENGLIDLDVDRPQSILARTRNGDVNLTVPTSRYRVTTRTDNGDLYVDVINQPDGAYDLDVATANGGIAIREKK